MDFAYSKTCQSYLDRVRAFMDEHIYPNEKTYHEQLEGFGQNRWQVLPVIEELKEKAKADGLWNLFLPDSDQGAGLSNQDYAPLAEEMGRVLWAPARPLRLLRHGRDHDDGKRHAPGLTRQQHQQLVFKSARSRIPAIWKCWCAMEHVSNKNAG